MDPLFLKFPQSPIDLILIIILLTILFIKISLFYLIFYLLNINSIIIFLVQPIVFLQLIL